MSVIRAKTVDQFLSITDRPVIASGNVNTESVEVELDNNWNFNIGVTYYIFFFRKLPESGITIQLETSNGIHKCIVPAEILSEPGWIHFAIYAKDENSTIVKASTLVDIKVKQGAYTGLQPAVNWESIAKEFRQSIISSLNIKFGTDLPDTATTAEILTAVDGLSDGRAVKASIIAMLNSATDYINSQADTSQGEEIGYYAVPLELLSETMTNETLSATINSNFQKMGNTTAYYLGVMQYLDEMKMELDNESVIGGDTNRDVRSLAYSILQKIIVLKNNSGVLINNILGIFENDDEIHLDSASSTTEISEAISGVVSQRIEIINNLYSLYAGDDE